VIREHLMLGIVGASLLVAGAGLADSTPIDTAQAARCFAEARAISDRDHGALWGVPLYGPMLFGDPMSASLAGNQPDSAGVLKPAGSVFAGPLPPTLSVSNTAVRWSGKRWTMIRWPLPRNDRSRSILMAHEMWHRVQDGLGFPLTNPDNPQLDTADGRLWMRLEWRALSAALGARGDARREAATDALMFRRARRLRVSGADLTERALEMNEGLASYTGARLGTNSDSAATASARAQLADAENEPTYVRSFAYATGPAYGMLLDAARPTWRKGLTKTDDLGDLLGRAMSIRLHAVDSTNVENARRAGWTEPVDPTAQERARRYGGDSLRVTEDLREQARQIRLQRARQRLVDGPVLLAPLVHANVSFDPANLMPLDSLGTVYPNLRLTDDWGILEAHRGALVSADWSSVRAPAPDSIGASLVRGDGWRIQLNPGWRAVPGTRSGDVVIEKGK
jgi:hypothetical protein